jgi:hypothetical protein
MSVVEDIKLKYQEKMVSELNKFLAVYNQIANTSISFSLEDYPFIIRVIGNYVSHLDLGLWLDSTISFNDEMKVEMHVFRCTVYEENVKQFVGRLKKAFHYSLDEEIERYLDNTDEFVDEEKVLCLAFHERASKLNRAMKDTMFNDVDTDVLSKDVISARYASELREFNEYTRFISSRPEVARVIQRFDVAVKTLASKKVPTEIFFDA